ncbi:hypothetical protein [Acetilactobacillus jinshanensis]|nr:hypothetical protein [Acetilactobacillus jinshanensis]
MQKIKNVHTHMGMNGIMNLLFIDRQFCILKSSQSLEGGMTNS